MLKKVLFGLFIIMLSFCNVYAYGYRETNEKTGYKLIVEDDSSVFSVNEVSNIKNMMRSLTEYGNIILRIESCISPSEEYAKKIYQDNFQEANGTIVLYDKIGGSFYIASVGNNSNILTQEKVSEIIQSSKSDSTSKSVLHETEMIITKIGFLLSGKEIPEAYVENNNTSKYKMVIEDDAGLLTEEEKENLSKEMIPLTEYGNIILKTISINETSTEQYARNYYHENYGTESGTVLLIDMARRMIYIFSDGSNYNVITSSKANIITDNIYRYASNEDYYTCASEAFIEMRTILDGGKIMEPMRHISNMFIAIILAFLFNFIFLVNYVRLKKAGAKEVLSGCDINVNISNIKGVKTGVDRVYSPIESSSSGSGFSGGGGSSGGGGGGGGSSGGGGGHSF